MTTKHLIRSAVLTLATCVAATSSHAYSSIVAFGDSLSDTGRLQTLLAIGGIDLPAAPYVGDRFSNGPVAVEVMAQALGVSLTSYAYGGAQTGLGNHVAEFLVGTGMQGQVNQYLSSLGGTPADAQALYFLWGGANDLFTLLDSGAPDASAVIGQAVTNLSTQVGQLHAQGAREFFVPLMPNLAQSYDGVQGGAPVQAALTQLSAGYNGALSAAMSQLQASLPDASIRVFNTQAVLEGVRADLLAQGGVLGERCWTGDYQGNNGSLCANPDQYYLFDAVHPTAVVHRATGLAMAAAVPEPQTYALILAGLGVVAASTVWRRRRPAECLGI